MSLNVFTDISDTSWLEYILEEFRIIQAASFDIKVVQVKKTTDKLTNALFYTSKKSEPGPWIEVNHQLDGQNELSFEPNLYYLANTKSKFQESSFDFDILWNAFFFLSRKEEYDSEMSGNHVKSYAARHPRRNKKSFEIAIVNEYFILLEKFISTHFPELSFNQVPSTKISLSHDLDYLSKTLQLRIKQSAFNGYNAIKNIFNPALFKEKAIKSYSFLFGHSDYWQFDYWKDIDARVECRSIFYVYSGTSSKSIKNWLVDPSYQIESNTKLITALKDLYDSGVEIGIHGSYESAINLELLAQEQSRLSMALDIPITKSRQHWLNFVERKTPYIHEELFDEDSTIGFNDQIGFRAGCCSKYRPYDHQTGRAFNYFIVPQIIMDASIFDYNYSVQARTISCGMDMIRSLKNYKNSHVSISWHPRTSSRDYNWHYVYEEYLKAIKDEQYI